VCGRDLVTLGLGELGDRSAVDERARGWVELERLDRTSLKLVYKRTENTSRL